MCKLRYFLSALSLLVLFCTIQHDNPLDPQNPEYVAPRVFVDSAASNVNVGDTIHVDSISIVYSGNDTVNEYRAWLDNDTTQGWTSATRFTAIDLSDGKHVFHLKTRYEGGEQTTEDSVVFFVLLAGYTPKFSQSTDTSITVTLNTACTLSVDPAVIVPVEFQWYKDSRILAGQDGKRLYIQHMQIPDTGYYYCMASTLFGSGASRTFRLTVPPSTDITPPSIKLRDPSINGSTISADSKKIEVVVKDSGFVKAVRFRTVSDSFPVTHYNDTVFFATVTGLPPGEAATITIEAWDTSGNRSELNMQLKYDPTANDNQPPLITRLSGPVNGQRVITDTGAFVFRISDQSQIDSVYYKLNGSFVAALAIEPDSVYDLPYKLQQFGPNQFDVFAVDSSSAHNQSHETIGINYNTKISGFEMVAPEVNATDLEYASGIQLKWTKATDLDGDSIKYEVHYSDSTTAFKSVSTKEDSMRLTDLLGGKTYYYFILAITVFDTAWCPAEAGTFNWFRTKNHNATIKNFNDQSVSINDTLTYNVTADDPEVIREYRWDLYGDGKNIEVTAIGSVTFKAPATPGTYKSILTVVDQSGGSTKKEVSLTVTNIKPVISGAAKTLNCHYGDQVSLKMSATDDGKGLEYFWTDGSVEKEAPNGDLTINALTTPIPNVTNYYGKVKDNDGNFAYCTTAVAITLDTTTLSGNEISGYTFLMAGDTCYKLKSKAVYSSPDFVNWTQKPDIGGVPVNANAICGKSNNSFISPNIFNQYLVMSTGGLSNFVQYNSNLPYQLREGAMPMDGLQLIWLSNKILLLGGWRQGSSGNFVYNDTMYQTDYNLNMIASGVYQAPLYKIPTWQSKDTVLFIHGRTQKRICKFVYNSNSSNLTEVYNKQLTMPVNNEKLVSIKNGILIVTEGKVYLSKDDGDTFKEIAYLSDNPRYVFNNQENKVIIIGSSLAYRFNLESF
jgi:hypothetical protein